MSGSRLPPLAPDAVLRLSREGGVAAIPALRGERQIPLERLEPSQRMQLQSLLEECSVHSLPQDRAGAGDRRYFAIAWAGGGSLRVAEEQAPEALVRLWKEGRLA